MCRNDQVSVIRKAQTDHRSPYWASDYQRSHIVGRTYAFVEGYAAMDLGAGADAMLVANLEVRVD